MLASDAFRASQHFTAFNSLFSLFSIYFSTASMIFDHPYFRRCRRQVGVQNLGICGGGRCLCSTVCQLCCSTVCQLCTLTSCIQEWRIVGPWSVHEEVQEKQTRRDKEANHDNIYPQRSASILECAIVARIGEGGSPHKFSIYGWVHYHLDYISPRLVVENCKELKKLDLNFFWAVCLRTALTSKLAPR